MDPSAPGAEAGAVTLRAVTEADLPILFEYQRAPASTRVAAVPARPRPAFDAHWQRILADPTITTQTILYDGQVAGSLVSWAAEGTHLVGYWLGQEYWGRGIATRALAAFLPLLPARPLYAHVAQHNPASR